MSQTEDPIPELSGPAADTAPRETPLIPAQVPAPKARRGGFVGGLFGGVLAAGLGFGAAQVYPNGWPLAATGDLQATLTQQAAELQALKAELQRLSQASLPDPTLSARVSALEGKPDPVTDLSPLDHRLATLESRLAAIEALPADGTGASPAAIAALQAEVQALKAGGSGATGLESLTQETEAKIRAAGERAAALQAETEAMVAQARARTALGQVIAAMDSGTPYASLLPDLGEVPAALSHPAASGVPTLAQLRDSFPDAARAALEASLQADMGATWSDRIGSFLRAQTGARSLEPREGNDPDAILSRAEAALKQGDLAAALAEAEALPDAGKAAMSDWRTLAEVRLAAVAALTALSAKIDG